MGEHGQEPQHNLTFVQSATPTSATAIVEAFANESYKTKSSDDINQDKMVTLKAKIKAIERVNLYDLVHVVQMCLISNVVVPKKFCVPEFIKYTGTQCPITHLKSYYNKMEKVVNDKKKLLMHFFQDSLNGATLNWYMKLNNTKIRKWKDLMDVFFKHTSTTWISLLIELAYLIWKRGIKKA
jgi:hypothetical protein